MTEDERAEIIYQTGVIRAAVDAGGARFKPNIIAALDAIRAVLDQNPTASVVHQFILDSCPGVTDCTVDMGSELWITVSTDAEALGGIWDRVSDRWPTLARRYSQTWHVERAGE